MMNDQTTGFTNPHVNRRTIFQAAAAGTALTTLAACAEVDEGTEGSVVGEDVLSKILPDNIPFEGGPTPDLPGMEDGTVDPGYLSRPDSIIQAVTEPSILAGEEITAITPLWNPAPPGLPNNTYFNAVNEALGGVVNFNIADGNSYGDRISTVLASGEMPDMFQIPGWELGNIADFPEAANNNFADLSPYLAGDKVAEYPLLANYKQAQWGFGVFGGTLLGIPNANAPYVNALFVRQDILDELGLAQPTNLEELLALAEEINDPEGGRWAFAGIDQLIQQSMGVPSLWKFEGDTIVHKFESDAMVESIEFIRGLHEKKLIHPDYVADRYTNSKEIVGSGKAVIYEDGYGAWHEMFGTYSSTVEGFDIQAISPLPKNASSPDPIVWRADPAGMFTFIKKDLSEERIKDCLRVANWCSAPFGTTEWDLVWDGVEGEHFNVNADGMPERTDLGNAEVANTYLFLSGRPTATFQFQYPGFVEAAHAWQSNAREYLQDDPFYGIRIEMPSDMSGQNQPVDDALHEIYRGHRDISEWEGIVDDWRANGGDAGREFYLGVAEEYDLK